MWYFDGSLFKIFKNLNGANLEAFKTFCAKIAQIWAKKCDFGSNLTENLGDLVFGWVPSSRKIGIWMGGFSNFPAARPYPNQT